MTTEDYAPLKLLPPHAALLAASAISHEVAIARGYSSVTTRVELERLGFGRAQRSIPALLIPIRTVHGRIATYQIRPDQPRIRDGKPVKYETPHGTRMVIDIPPAVRGWLGNPARPLFITEGVRKADAATSRGLCCIGLLGVWNFRGTNQYGGKVALPDWESIALNDRLVYIVFDSDVMLKPEVYQALGRLKDFLESRGARVALVYLPPAEGAGKMGLDDFFAAGHSVEELLALATTELRPLVGHSQNVDTGGYVMSKGRISRLVEDGDSYDLEDLTNFSAAITEELLLDDGIDAVRAFLIDGELATGTPLPPVRVPAAQFGNMAWVIERWGVDAVLRAGLGVRDQVREAIQRFSRDVLRRRVFTHTGWRQLDGEWVFLTANGAVGWDDVEVDLGPELERYWLPRVPEDPVEAMRTSLRLLEVSALEVTVPLWAAVYRAPLASALPPDLSLWLAGVTGSLKSTLSALFLGHYGNFDRTHLPGAWASTANQLEKRAFTLKDVLFLVDDFAPTGWDARELDTKAARLLRAQGNLSGRGRLRSDLSERRAFPPRGLIVATAEQRPTGQSILARTLVLDVARKQADLALLSQAQAGAARLPHALAGYIEWLGPRMPNLAPYLRDRFNDIRQFATSGTEHLRVPEIIAHLWLGLELALHYAQDIGACSEAQAAAQRERAWEVLRRLGQAQATLVEEERPTHRFLRALSTLLALRRVFLCPSAVLPGPMPGGPHMIGWRDKNYFFLMPDAAYAEVAAFCREAGEPLPPQADRLRQDLAKEGLTECEAGRTTLVVKLAGKSHRVLKLKISAVEELLGEHVPDDPLDAPDDLP